MNRRNFFSMLTLGAVAPACAVASQYGITSKSDFEKDGPLDTRMFAFRAGIKKAPIQPQPNCYILQEQYSEYAEVNMSVGQDGHLWIKPQNGQWKRVVTE